MERARRSARRRPIANRGLNKIINKRTVIALAVIAFSITIAVRFISSHFENIQEVPAQPAPPPPVLPPLRSSVARIPIPPVQEIPVVQNEYLQEPIPPIPARKPLVPVFSNDSLPLEYGLVAYWDGSGRKNVSRDIAGGGYDAALGSSAFITSINGIHGFYINSTPAANQSDGTWTKSDDGVWDAIGDGNEAFTFSFWYVTTSRRLEDNLVNFVGSDYVEGDLLRDVTHSPFIIQLGDYEGGTWFWRGYANERNRHDMRPYANGKWHHVVLAQNKTGAFAYLDGVSLNSLQLNHEFSAR